MRTKKRGGAGEAGRGDPGGEGWWEWRDPPVSSLQLAGELPSCTQSAALILPEVSNQGKGRGTTEREPEDREVTKENPAFFKAAKSCFKL